MPDTFSELFFPLALIVFNLNFAESNDPIFIHEGMLMMLKPPINMLCGGGGQLMRKRQSEEGVCCHKQVPEANGVIIVEKNMYSEASKQGLQACKTAYTDCSTVSLFRADKLLIPFV